MFFYLHLLLKILIVFLFLSKMSTLPPMENKSIESV